MKKTNIFENRLLLPENRLIDDEKNYSTVGTDSSIVHDISASYQCKTLDDAELLSALSGIKLMYTMEILKKYRLHEIEDYLDSLIPKITEHQKKIVITAFEFSRRIFRKIPENGHHLRSPQELVAFLDGDLRYLKKEVFICIHLNIKNLVLRKEIISVGSLNSCIVHPREVFSNAIKHSVASVILCHNHPSGDPQPSLEDTETTKRLVEAGNILGIKVLDHIIIGNGEYFSFREKGLI